jgi:hypothetical protein
MSRVSRCQFCGAFTQQGDRFCWSCGSQVQLPEAPPSQVSRPAAEPDPVVQLTLRRVYLAQRRGNLVEAERLVREALERQPDSVSALALLSEILRGKGDLVGAVDAAQRATEAAGRGPAPPGSLRRAREERAQIEQTVVEELQEEPAPAFWSPISIFSSVGGVWHQSGPFYLGLAGIGLVGLVLALVSVLRGGALGYVWFAVSLAAAGWCYYDAETRRESGLFWGPFVLCLGPFGLAIYLLTRY